MNKKAQGMSMTVIIVAALALIVLVVLAVIFSGKIGLFGKGAGDMADVYSTQKCVIPGTSNVCIEADDILDARDKCSGAMLGKKDCPDKEYCCAR